MNGYCGTCVDYPSARLFFFAVARYVDADLPAVAFRRPRGLAQPRLKFRCASIRLACETRRRNAEAGLRSALSVSARTWALSARARAGLGVWVAGRAAPRKGLGLQLVLGVARQPGRARPNRLTNPEVVPEVVA